MLADLKKKFHHYFLPHESNNYRARSLHNSAIIFYIVLLVSFQIFTGVLARTGRNVLGYATDISVDKILTLVNQKRAEANLSPLTLSDQLSQASTQKANDMFSKNYWAHISPTGTTPWVFINSSGYQYLYAGENLARNFNSSAEVVDAWMNSPSHRANIMKPEYKDIGLAVMNGKLDGEDTTLVVEEFGAKANPVVADIVPTAIPQQPLVEKSVPPVQASVSDQKPLGSSAKNNFSLPFSSTKTVSLALTEFLLVVLFIDSIYLWRSKTARLSGHSLAHIIFLGALIGAMGATGIGGIL